MVIFAIALGTFPDAAAQAYVELNAFYSSDAVTAASTTSNGRTFFEGSIGFSIDKNYRYLAGWNYSSISSTDKETTTITYAATHMGPRFIFSLDKNHNWTLGFGYYLTSSASYSSGTTATWSGTATKVDLGYNAPVTDNFLIGVRLNYLAATYTSQLVGSTTYTTVAYARTSIYPSLYTMYLF